MERGRYRTSDRAAGLKIGLVALGLAVGCVTCSTTPSSDDGGEAEACTFASCEEACRARGLCYGSCGGGRCGCSTNCGGEVDARPDTAWDRWEATDRGDLDAADRPETDDGEIEECPQLVPDEVRAGASRGVLCRRMSVREAEHGLYEYSGDGDRIVYAGAPARGGRDLWLTSRTTRCARKLEEGEGPDGQTGSTEDPSIEQSRVAFAVSYSETPTTNRCELRLLDIETGNRRTLDANTSANREPDGALGCFIDYISLEYPWVVWRDIRQDATELGDRHPYRPNILAVHAESGERFALNVDPIAGATFPGILTGCGGVVDLEDGLAVFDDCWWDPEAPPGGNIVYEVAAFDFVSRRWIQITDAPYDQFRSTVSADWIAWTDLRNAGGWTWFRPCHADIYGYDRRTGEEVALVWEGTAVHGPEVDAKGPWLAYVDHRWSSDLDCPDQPRQDIVAMHLPTRTEIRITDWPGRDRNPQLYDRRDGTYGLLLAEEEPGGIYLRLWDCDLPEPAGGGGG